MTATSSIDLTGGEVKVLGNRGDTHLFRLSDPSDEPTITEQSEFEIEFTSVLGGTNTDTEVDTADISEGKISFTLVVSPGVYRVRRLNPRRTLVTIEVDIR